MACKRKTVLTAAGDTERYTYYVTEGLQRAFALAEGQKEATLMFSYPGSFSGIIDSFFLQQPSRYYLKPSLKAPFYAFHTTTYSG